jgi:cell division protein FtsW (lipid II flippase)
MELISILLILVIVAFFVLIMASTKIRGGLKWGIFFIALGLLIWLGNMNLLPYINWSRDWPWILVFLGLLFLLRPFFRKSRRDIRKKVENVLKDLEAGKITPEEAEKKIKRLK